MFGAIVGDVISSVYKGNGAKTKDFTLFKEGSHFTGDTVMTIATADALMRGGEKDDFIDAYKEWGELYPDAIGGGPAARVSPCGWVKKGREKAKRSAEATHKDLESVDGAIAVVDTMMMCHFHRASNDKMFRTLMKEHVEKGYGYDVEIDSENIVSQALAIFLQSTGFEDAVRNAICLGKGNSALTTIVGSVAEIAYGVPELLEDEALSYVDIELLHVVNRWRKFIAE